MSRPWKHLKTGIYWLRKRVPDDLRVLLGKTEEKQSLGTHDPAEAKIKQMEALVMVEARRANLRAFSSESDTGSREENAIKQYLRAVPRFEELLYLKVRAGFDQIDSI